MGKTVQVSSRIRPLSTAESSNPDIKTAVSCLDGSVIVDSSVGKDHTKYFGARHAAPRPKRFHFDNVFHPHCSQIEVYEAVGHQLVEEAFQGINGSVMAYGATGSGKTHTMFGNATSAPGLVFQAMQDVFDTKTRLEMRNKFVSVRCSFFEVYNEHVYDLLSTTRQELRVRDIGEGRGGILDILGLSQETPSTNEEFIDLIERGRTNRFTAATGANAESSRSHAILSLEIEVKDTPTSPDGILSKVKMCDLAGSERAANTSNTGLRLKEGGNINKSLLALGNVVQALASNVKKNSSTKEAYVPYRGSKLTRLLRDCIGGNCNTAMIFCASPSSHVAEETVNTMHFAMQAKEIQVATKRNEFNVDKNEVARNRDKIIETLRTEVASLKDELYRLRLDGPLAFHSATANKENGGGGEAVDCSHPRVRHSSELLYKDVAVECNPMDCTLHYQDEIGESGEDLAAVFQQIRSIRRERESILQQLGEVDVVREINLEMNIRTEKKKIAEYCASMDGTIDRSTPPPVGIVGAQEQITRHNTQLQKNTSAREALLEKLNELDLKTEKMRQEVFSSKRNGGGQKGNRQWNLIEVMMENLSLAITRAEAECNASEYYQRSISHEQIKDEMGDALRMCVSVLRKAQEQGRFDSNPQLASDVSKALAYSTIPFSTNKDLLENFQEAMKGVNKARMSMAPRSSVRQEFFDASNKRATAMSRHHTGGNNGGGGGSTAFGRYMTYGGNGNLNASAGGGGSKPKHHNPNSRTTQGRLGVTSPPPQLRNLPAWNQGNGGMSGAPKTTGLLSTPLHSFNRTLSLRKAPTAANPSSSNTNSNTNKENGASK